MAFKLKSGNTSAFKMMGSSPVKQKAKKPMMAAEKKYDSGKTTSKSDADLFIARSTEVKNPRTGENLATEYMESGSEKKGYRIPVTKGKEKRNMGLYTVKDEETGKEVPVDPRDESIAPSNVVKGVKAGSDYQKAFKKYNKSRKKSPTKQRSTKGGEAQDQDKIFDAKGKHVGTYVNGKKVMKSTTSKHGQLDDAERDFKRDMDRARPNKAKDKALNKMLNKKSPAKQTKLKNLSGTKSRGSVDEVNLSKMSGLGPRTAFGGVKNPELVKKKKTKSKKVMKDGPKKQAVHKGKVLKGNWQPHQFNSPAKQLKGSGHGPATKFDKKRYPVGNPELTDKNPFNKDKYYYKIDGKATTKAAYLKYKNKPGNMEGGGKQTNNPDVYGRKKGGSPSNPK